MSAAPLNEQPTPAVPPRRWFTLIVRVALGALLVGAGVMKFTSGWSFSELIANYRLLPAAGNQIVAVILPWCEISAGLLLIFGIWTRAAAMLSVLFFAAFTVAIVSALARGLDIECGCFGTQAAATVGGRALALDAVGLAASLFVMLRGSVLPRALDSAALAG